jgi:uncharacterized protein YbjT (DUF2867 family)
MKVVVLGANGMVGGGVVLECLEDPRVDAVLAVGRRGSGLAHPRLREVLVPDLFALDPVVDELRGCDACFYCVGVSSLGMSEHDYRRITLDLTVAVMSVLAEVNPGIKLCFVSGQGSDGTESGRVMWARVKGEAENHVLGLPQETYVFRPGFIQPLKGVRSATRLYRALYTVTAGLYPLLKRVFPGGVTTSVNVGRAMINAVSTGYPKRILENRDINALAEAG